MWLALLLSMIRLHTARGVAVVAVPPASPVAVSVDGGGITSIAVPGGPTYSLLRGSGTQLQGCSSTADPTVRTLGSTTTLTRTLTCQPNQFHDVRSAVVTVTDTFTPTASGSVRWTANLSSSAFQPWGTAITAALGFSSWTNGTTRAWLGGPHSSEAPSLHYDPFAAWSLSPAAAAGGAAAAAATQHAPRSNGSWYTAKGYDATYDCMTGPCVKVGVKPTFEACQNVCAARAATTDVAGKQCNVFAWSERSKDCWLRTDSLWGQNSTLHPYGAISGCRTGADPVSGNPWVKGCGTMPPIGPSPPPGGGPAAKYWYGSQDNDIGKREMTENTATVLPMLTRIDASPAHDSGISVLLSPEDTPISAYASAALTTGGGGAWLNFTRLYHRLGAGAEPISFSADIVAHAADWRPAAQWMVDRYPPFFAPDPATATTMRRIFGTGAYADLRGPPDFDASAAKKYKEFGWALNWDSTAQFPWHGEWIPTAKDGFGPDWVSCFAHGPPDGHTGEGCHNASYALINSWYEHIRAMGKGAGTEFSSCQYGNLLCVTFAPACLPFSCFRN